MTRFATPEQTEQIIVRADAPAESYGGPWEPGQYIDVMRGGATVASLQVLHASEPDVEGRQDLTCRGWTTPNG